MFNIIGTAAVIANLLYELSIAERKDAKLMKNKNGKVILLKTTTKLNFSVVVAFIEISSILNWGSLLLLVAIVYYCIISIPLAIGMLPFISIIFVLQVYLQNMTEYALIISILLTVASVVGICTGHHKEERLTLVLKDIQLVIIAPLWLLSLTYRRLGIPY